MASQIREHNGACRRLTAVNSRFALTIAGLALALTACSVVGARPSASTAPIATPAVTTAPLQTLPTTAPASVSPSSPAPTNTLQPSSSAQSDLDGRQFVSVIVIESGESKVLVPGTKIRLGFSDGMISASAGCNSMGGTYQLAGGKLNVGDMATTDMGCQSNLMAQDEWLAGFVGSGPQVALDGSDLLLTSETTEITLQDREQAEPDQPLTGITWGLTTIIDGDAASSVPGGIVATLLFADDGTFTFNDGCNSGGGKFATEGPSIAFTEIVSTKKACPGDSTAVENAIFTILDADSVTYSIDHSTLSLLTGNHGLQYDAAVDVN